MRWLLGVLMLLALAAPARADDISVAARGVVRIVTIASAEGEIVGFGHGSGFAIAPNRVVTNAHVVELAARYPDNVVIGVVPSEGDKSYQGKLVAYDAKRDLAIIQFGGVSLPPLSLYPGPVEDGETVIALGYPGNVDVATAQSAADFIKPLTPVRTQGGFAGRRALQGVEVLLHTAGIARGNSGGPLLDRCGRVIGVNSAITKAEEGDSTFGFAIADTEFAAFLRESGQSYQTVGTPCVPLDQRLREQQDASARQADAQAQASSAERARAEAARAAAIDAARLRQERTRENYIAVAALILVLGALAVGGAGLLETRGRRREALWSLGGGAALMIAAVVIFFLRPFGDPKLPAEAAAITGPVATAYEGKLACRFDPARSRLNFSSPKDIEITWTTSGCVNERTQYVENGRHWERILVPNASQTVSALDYEPGTRTYVERRYYLPANAMAAARKLRGAVTIKACTADQPAQLDLQRQQEQVRAALPQQPDEWLTYACTPAR